MQLGHNPNRPSLSGLTVKKLRTVAFGPIKSPLMLAREALDTLRADPDSDVGAIAKLEAAYADLLSGGAQEWVLEGECLESPGTLEGMTVTSVAEDLIQRFIVSKESLFNIPTERITRLQCRLAAQVFVTITKLKGGDPYSVEELLAMPFYEGREDLWVALYDIASAVWSGEAATLTTSSA